jgi:hypothetical protein
MGSPASGSINEVGQRFRSSGINNLEMVDQNIASWNRLTSWLRQIERFGVAGAPTARTTVEST